MMQIDYLHLLLFALVVIPVWFLAIYFWPGLILSVYKWALMVKGFGDGPIPVNTLYTQPQKLFAEPVTAQTASSSNLMTVGVNHDTLSTAAWLDLGQGPLVLHGRVLVKSDSDVATAYDLSKQIRLTPLSQWKPGL